GERSAIEVLLAREEACAPSDRRADPAVEDVRVGAARLPHAPGDLHEAARRSEAPVERLLHVVAIVDPRVAADRGAGVARDRVLALSTERPHEREPRAVVLVRVAEEDDLDVLAAEARRGIDRTIHQVVRELGEDRLGDLEALAASFAAAP